VVAAGGGGCGVAMADLVLVFGKGVFIEVEAAKENEDMLYRKVW